MKNFIFAIVMLIGMVACTNTTKSEITAEMAYEGVSNYCHSAYDWSMAEENPSIMYVQMGEETDSAYQVVFRSYTGAFVNFYVDKISGTTRMEEYVPTLDVRSEAGTIELFDYLGQKKWYTKDICEAVRQEQIQQYIQRHGMKVKFYQDFGWDPVEL